MPTVVSTGAGRGGPNIQYPIGSSSLFQNRMNFGGGFGLASQRLKSAKKPGTPDIPVPTDLQGLTQTQGGNFNDPASMWANLLNIRQGGGGLPQINRERLGALATANAAYGGIQRPTGLGAAAPGYGDVGSFGSIRKLIAQRLGGAF